ncbi:MAG: tail fiber domain-containing protein [Lewinellaceae bacterium]|nr:tail fiber domain-containing protein [Saprospiraceae bacterium]MCB9342050.1 tail fiber domain-containing protein [Lewinellaceae bacterium]
MKTLGFTLLTTLFLAVFSLPSFAQLKVIADGKVGIGTATPEAQLDVVGGNLQARGQFVFTGKDAAAAAEAGVLVGWGRTGTGSSAIRFYPSWTNFGSWATTFGVDGGGGGGLFHQGANTLGIVTLNTQAVGIGVNSVYKVYVNGTSGNVGINMTAPSTELELNGVATKPGGGTWTAPSDRRLKKDVKPFQDGLKQVMAIEPVFFKYNGKGGLKDDGKEYVGIIAQDMQKVAPYTITSYKRQTVESVMKEGDFLPTEVVKDEGDYLAYDANALTYMLVNAIKEQQKMIDAKDAQINAMEERLERLERLMVTLNSTTTGSQTIDLSSNGNGYLMQNQPNPFNHTTAIRYTLPEDAKNASLRIMDSNGRMLKEVKLADTKGEVTINAGELNSGSYSYSLIVDGRIIDTKQMILTK